MSSTDKYDAETRPFSSRARGDAKRRRSSKKNRKSDNKLHRYPTRRELEGKNHAKLEEKLQEVRAAEERTQRRYEQLKRAGTLDGEDGGDRTSDLEIATAATCADQQSQQGSPTNEVRWPGCARLVKIANSYIAALYALCCSCYPRFMCSLHMQGGSVAGVQAAVKESIDKMKVQSSWSTETTVGSTATSLDMHTLDTAYFTVHKDAEPERIEYTPEEMRCNDLMMQIEGEALERVQREAIDAHSAALQ